MKKLKILILTIALIAAAQVAGANNEKFELNLDKARVALGESAQLGLTFYDTQSIPAPDIGNIDGIDIRYMGPSTMMTVINGQISHSVTHMYKILPLKVGRFQLGPFSFKLKGNSYSSNIVFLDVAEERVARARTAEPTTTEELKLGDRIYLTMEVANPTAYVNELIPVKVKLYVNRLNVSEIQLPTFEQEGFSKVEFKEPKQYRQNIGGLTYDVLEFNTSIFGTRAGDYKLGPAKLKCNVVTKKRSPGRRGTMEDEMFGNDQFNDSFFDDFFTRIEKHPVELKSPDVQLVISPLPASGRPSDFSGAVGDYQFVYRASPVKLKVGDPVTVRMEINGSGNFNTVLEPRMDKTAGFKVYDPQVKTEEHTKTFTRIMIPENELVTQIPRASFSYFDPAKKEYKQIAQNPIPIQVEKGKEELPPQVIGPLPGSPDASSSGKMKDEELARDLIYIKETPGRWLSRDYSIYRNRVFMVLFIMPVMFLAVLWGAARKRDRFRRDTAYAGRILALKASRQGAKNLRLKLKVSEQKAFYEALFEALQGYLGNRLGIPPAGVTGSVVEEALRARGADPGILGRVKNLFEACDRSRFAFQQVDIIKMKDDAKDFEDMVKHFERRKI